MADLNKQERQINSRLAHPPYMDAGGASTEAIAAASLVPEHLLDGDEIVIFAIKPSLWFVVYRSFRWLVSMVVVIMMAGFIRQRIPEFNTLWIVQAAVVLGAARFVMALLQWVSRLYVLTNRRILRLTGVLNVDLFECSLTKIQNTYLTMTWYERLVGVGSISFATAGTGGIEASWINVNNPLEIHERVRSAIHRAQRPGNGL